MPLPTVDFCILCEGVRAEPNGKANILGFYGVLPAATVLVAELNKQVPVLMLLVSLHGPGDETSLELRLTGPNESPVVAIEKTKGLKLLPVPEGEGALAGILLANATFSQEGKHLVRLFLNDELKYENYFNVKQGQVIR